MASKRTNSVPAATREMTPYEKTMAIVAVGGLLASIGAIVISAYQTQAMRQEVRWRIAQSEAGVNR